MQLTQFTVSEWFLLVHHELLLFTAVFLAIGVLDEIAVDLTWFWLRISGKLPPKHVDEADLNSKPLMGQAAVFIPTWQESAVIGSTIHHMLESWLFKDLRLYVGCYQNDHQTIASVIAASRGDPRVRLVIHGVEGPTSKADCLNRLYRALCEDEHRSGISARMVVLHDAEDMVDPAALPLLDRAVSQADFVQLPVLALPQSNSRMIGSHYSDEFAEAHGKALVVRDALRAAIPGAGVGCAISRPILARFGPQPFASQSLTEDYELGLHIAEMGGRGRFLRSRTSDGRLIATRAYFPSHIDESVRQKTRWMHGIALQGWDRLGWRGSAIDIWMQLRDRRGPLASILLTIAYLLVVMSALVWVLAARGIIPAPEYSSFLAGLLTINLAGLLWRLALRGLFTGREFGWREGLRAMPRLFVSNIIAIMAARRALLAYVRTLRGAPIIWDKTEHRDHPAFKKAQA